MLENSIRPKETGTSRLGMALRDHAGRKRKERQNVVSGVTGRKTFDVNYKVPRRTEYSITEHSTVLRMAETSS